MAEPVEPYVDLEMSDAPVKLILQRLADIGHGPVDEGLHAFAFGSSEGDGPVPSAGEEPARLAEVDAGDVALDRDGNRLETKKRGGCVVAGDLPSRDCELT